MIQGFVSQVRYCIEESQWFIQTTKGWKPASNLEVRDHLLLGRGELYRRSPWFDNLRNEADQELASHIRPIIVEHTGKEAERVAKAHAYYFGKSINAGEHQFPNGKRFIIFRDLYF
jgi:hypothetical protein